MELYIYSFLISALRAGVWLLSLTPPPPTTFFIPEKKKLPSKEELKYAAKAVWTFSKRENLSASRWDSNTGPSSPYRLFCPSF
jgi:hypothetical protein